MALFDLSENALVDERKAYAKTVKAESVNNGVAFHHPTTMLFESIDRIFVFQLLTNITTAKPDFISICCCANCTPMKFKCRNFCRHKRPFRDALDKPQKYGILRTSPLLVIAPRVNLPRLNCTGRFTFLDC